MFLFAYYCLEQMLIYLINFAAKIIMDHDTGRSRGFGFVTFAFNEEASSAIRALDGQVLIFFLSSSNTFIFIAETSFSDVLHM